VTVIFATAPFDEDERRVVDARRRVLRIAAAPTNRPCERTAYEDLRSYEAPCARAPEELRGRIVEMLAPGAAR
jgi:hypothetical protein